MSDTGDNERQGVASIAKNAIFVIAIYAYFIGWVYSYYLFNHFGIPLTSVEIPVYFFFIYAYPVIANWWGALIAVAILRLVYVFSVVSYRPAVVVTILVALFPVASYLSVNAAEHQVRLIRTGDAKTISFVFKENTKEHLSRGFLEANINDELKLITQTADQFFVVHQPGGEGQEIPYGFVYVLSKDDILLAKIEMHNISKGGEH